MRIVATEETYYLICPEGSDINRILETVYNNTGMRKGSFADREVRKIFRNLFDCAVDLKACYSKYYKEEYDSFGDFLYQKETMEHEEIDSMKLQDGDALWKLQYEINSYGVRDIIGYENENLPLLNLFLEGIRI